MTLFWVVFAVLSVCFSGYAYRRGSHVVDRALKDGLEDVDVSHWERQWSTGPDCTFLVDDRECGRQPISAVVDEMGDFHWRCVDHEGELRTGQFE